MCGINEMLLRVEQVKANIIPLTESIIQESDVEFDLIQLNKNQLYDSGVDSIGNLLAPYRSKHYADMKFQMRGKELTDLFLSGEFQRNFHIIVEGEQYGITSSDDKTGALIEKYGSDIFGINEESKPILTMPIIKPRLLEVVNDILQCTLE